MPLQFVESIAAKFAFFPPRPPSYAVSEHADGTNELYIEPLDGRASRVPQAIVRRIETEPTAKGEGGPQTIVTAWLPYSKGPDIKGSQQKTMTLLFSHGNAVDLAPLLPFLKDLGKALRCNVMGYDYSGYGQSTGGEEQEGNLPSVSQTFSDITSVYKHLINDLKIPPRTIIMYGQSVGSGPTSYLGAELSQSQLGGVILHSPIYSGLRVLYPNLWYWPSWLDVYPNYLCVPKINVPTLVMHGTDDQVIDVVCGRKLALLVKEGLGGEHLFPEGYTHQNIETSPDYLPTLQKFIEKVAERSEKELPSDDFKVKGSCLRPDRGSCIS